MVMVVPKVNVLRWFTLFECFVFSFSVIIVTFWLHVPLFTNHYEVYGVLSFTAMAPASVTLWLT
jgi:hypothetical protein